VSRHSITRHLPGEKWAARSRPYGLNQRSRRPVSVPPESGRLVRLTVRTVTPPGDRRRSGSPAPPKPTTRTVSLLYGQIPRPADRSRFCPRRAPPVPSWPDGGKTRL